MFTRAIGVLSVFLISGGLLFGQITTGTISGTVKDNSGAVMPGATVQIRNVETSISRSVSTDARGYYTAPNLSVGQYEITVSLSGFQTGVRRGITLNVGQNAVIDFTLQVGAVTERVEVVGEAPLIETTSATVAGLVSERQVQDLPLNARDLVSLGGLYSGVTMPTTSERSASKGFGTKLSISGTRYNQSLFQLDGVDVNDAANSAGGAAGILMGAETVREFNVITSGYSAEYGRHTGGVFNAVTKTGTNTLHGSVFEFLRNDNMDAARWEDNTFGGGVKPEYKRNQYGFSLGGPVVRDRTFFFGSFEGLRERLGRTRTFDVPGEDLRNGILPGTTTPVAIDPKILPYLLSWPRANVPGSFSATTGTAKYSDSVTLPTNEDFFTVRMDHTISGSDSLFGRYTFDDADNFQRSSFDAYEVNDSRNQYLALGETHIFSPAVINQFLAGYTRTLSAQSNQPVEGMVFPTTNFSDFEEAMGSISISGSGVDGWGGDSTYPRAAVLNMFQFKDDLFYTAGAHSLKFGFNAQRFRFKYGAAFNGGGSFSFSGLSNFLRGRTNQFNGLTADSQEGAYPQQAVYAMYAQDDWRVTPNLTVNLGLRYEFITVPAEKYGRLSNMRDWFGFNQTLDDILIGNPTFLNPSLKNFGPRVGLAWDPTGSGKTSIRAGAGIFHDQITAGPYLFGFYSSPPFVKIGTIRGTGVASFPDAWYSQQSLMAARSNMEGFQYKMDQPAVYKYSLDIQREVLPDTSVTLGFSASRAVHLLRVLLMNARQAEVRDGRLFIRTPAIPGGLGDFRSPDLARLRPRLSDSSSNYYAFRLGVLKRYSRSLQLNIAYTFSKAIDDGSNWTGSSDWQNSPGSARYLNVKERSLAAFDIRHVLSTNFTYDLPGQNLTGATGKVLGGWQVSGILSLQGGVPFGVSTGVPPGFFSNGYIGDYPDVVVGSEYKYDTRNTSRYYDPSPFVLPPGYSSSSQAQLGGTFIGNAGRTIMTAPGIAKFDLVLVKATAITERVNLQFRSEFFNLFNRANYGLPRGALFADTAGTLRGTVAEITNTTTTGREIQFGLRLVF